RRVRARVAPRRTRRRRRARTNRVPGKTAPRSIMRAGDAGPGSANVDAARSPVGVQLRLLGAQFRLTRRSVPDFVPTAHTRSTDETLQRLIVVDPRAAGVLHRRS